MRKIKLEVYKDLQNYEYDWSKDTSIEGYKDRQNYEYDWSKDTSNYYKIRKYLPKYFYMLYNASNLD